MNPANGMTEDRMIDERELTDLLDLTDPAPRPVPPLGQVVHRGRRLRRRRQMTKAVTVVAMAALALGVARTLPSPTSEIRTASVPGGDSRAPDFGDDGLPPTAPDQPPVGISEEGDGGAGATAGSTVTTLTTKPTTATTATTATTGPAPQTKGDGHGTTPSTMPIPHSTVETANGALADLSAAGLSPAFDPGTKYYTAPADHDIITVTARLADPDANLFIQSTRVNSGEPFRAWVGEGKSVDIVIYSDWKEIGRYVITRPGDTPPPPPTPHSTAKTTNGKLAGLTIQGLSPAFDPAVTGYTAPAGDHDRIRVTATLDDPDANLYIQSTRVNSGVPFDAWVGEGKESIDIVIYSDWTEIGRYTIMRSN